MYRLRTALYLPLLVVLSGVLVGCPQPDEQIALMVSPSVLDFGLTGSSQTFKVRKVNTAREMPPFEVSPGAPWIGVSPESGQSSGPLDPVTVTVTVDRSKMTSTANTALITLLTEGVPRQTVEVRARLALVAQFSADRTVAYQGETLEFFDQSATSGGGEISSWTWDFGDGTTSTEQSPKKAYTEAGTYTVSLTVSDGTSTHTASRDDYITVLAVTPPTADFKAEPTDAQVGALVQFVDMSTKGTNPITEWSWDFGDGQTSTDRNPEHAYAVEGKYTVTLTVRSLDLSDTAVKEEYITVSGSVVGVGPTAEFEGAPRVVAEGGTVQFTDLSGPGDRPIETWLWTFGDGASSSERSPSHVYETAGTYTVTLAVFDGVQGDTVSKDGYIEVLAPPEANFVANKTVVDVEEVVQFTDLSAPGTEPITKWEWTFGDGGTSGERNPDHAYDAPGQYTVKLTVHAGDLSDTMERVAYITVEEPTPPVAEFGSDRRTVQVNELIRFIDQSVSGTFAIDRWTWDFGDGETSQDRNPRHRYAAPGLYTVSLKVSDDGGFEDTEVKVEYIEVVAPPTADFAADKLIVGVNELVQFTDLSKPGSSPIVDWLWSFGDGQASTERNPAHAYAKAGVYSVALTVRGEDGLTDTLTRIAYITVKQAPMANFVADKTDVHVGEVVQFTDMSMPVQDPIDGWDWDFGNGETSTQRNPQHAYAAVGQYTVKLTVHAGGVSGTRVRVAYIKVSEPPLTADFTSDTQQALVNQAIQFTDQSIAGASPITGWEWDFGDGETSTERDPAHQYTNLGSYTVTLTVKDEDGGQDTEEKIGYIQIVPPLDAEFTGSPLEVVSGEAVQFTDLSTPGPNDSIAGWEWDFGDESDPATVPNPLHVYTIQGEGIAEAVYSVKLTVTTALGSIDVELKPDYIKVVEAPVDTATALFSISYPWDAPDKWFRVGDELSITNLSDDPSRGLLHGWQFGDGATSRAVHPVHVYTQAGGDTPFGIRLDVTDPAGGDPLTAEQQVRVFARTPLDDAVDAREQADAFTLVEEIATGSASYRAYAFQAADGAAMTVVVPEAVNGPTALLVLDDLTEGSVDLGSLGQAAVNGRSVVAVVDMGRLSGTAAVVRAALAMDAVETFTSGDARPVRTFLPTGSGQCGLTAWLTAAADPRVRAVAPTGVDVGSDAVTADTGVAAGDLAARVRVPMVKVSAPGGAVYLPESGLFYVDARVYAMFLSE